MDIALPSLHAPHTTILFLVNGPFGDIFFFGHKLFFGSFFSPFFNLRLPQVDIHIFSGLYNCRVLHKNLIMFLADLLRPQVGIFATCDPTPSISRLTAASRKKDN